MKHNYKKQGKANRAAGKRFELKVKMDLEKNGWIVFRNSNDVELEIQTKCPDVSSKEEKDKVIVTITEYEKLIGKFKQGKPKFNPFTKQLMMNSGGFPDFLCIGDITLFLGSDKNFPLKIDSKQHLFDVQFVECKVNGTLSKIEKQKIEWIKKELKIPVFIASKGEKSGTINYENK